MSRTFGYGKGDGTCEPVGVAWYERIEGGILVQMRLWVQQRPVLAAGERSLLCGSERLFRHACGDGKLALSRFLALGARFAVEVRIFLDVRFDGLLHRYDFECGEDILFGGILQRLHQRLVQFGLQRLLGGRTGHAQYDGRTPHAFGHHILQPALVAGGELGILAQQRQCVGPYTASLIKRIMGSIDHGFPFPIEGLRMCNCFFLLFFPQVIHRLAC